MLHFVNRNPGMKVADLLDVLKITKQSLGRVLKQLIDEGYVVQKEGANDRRQRLLYVSPAGEALAMKLAGLQTERIARVLAELGPGARDAARRFLAGMIDAEDRDRVLRLIAQADRVAAARPETARHDAPQRRQRPADDAPHLLVVDDDRRIRALLSRFLLGEGYRVSTAETRGRSARQARRPQIRSADPRRDDAGRERLRFRPRACAQARRCRS